MHYHVNLYMKGLSSAWEANPCNLGAIDESNTELCN